MVVPRKDGKIRFCVDYRQWKAATKTDSYLVPRMDECIASPTEARILTSLDCNSGYWQVEVDQPDGNRTTFPSHFGLYCLMRMPFGLRNARARFQRALDILLLRDKWQFGLVYLDDVNLYTHIFE